MNFLQDLIQNRIFVSAVLGWFIAQVLKTIIHMFITKKFVAERMIGSGGMPSSHSSFVTALTIGIGQTEGYNSALFAACAVLSFIVMYDAMGVRWESGQQAAVINRIVEMLQDPNIKLETQLKEILGHTPLQVFFGMLLGVAFGVLCF